MKRFFAFLLIMAMLFTACGSKPAEKYPPQKMDFGDGNYSWHYFDDKGQRIKYESYEKDVLYSWTESFYDENNSAIISVGYRADGTARWMNEYSEDADGNFVTQTSEYSENEELLKITRRTSTKNGFREEILFEK